VKFLEDDTLEIAHSSWLIEPLPDDMMCDIHYPPLRYAMQYVKHEQPLDTEWTKYAVEVKRFCGE